MCEPSDVANTVCFLASDAASYLTGQYESLCTSLVVLIFFDIGNVVEIDGGRCI